MINKIGELTPSASIWVVDCGIDVAQVNLSHKAIYLYGTDIEGELNGRKGKENEHLVAGRSLRIWIDDKYLEGRVMRAVLDALR